MARNGRTVSFESNQSIRHTQENLLIYQLITFVILEFKIRK